MVLGCPAALYLTGAGIGCIGLVDYDAVEISNLHRQLLHKEHLTGIPKTTSAKNSLTELNSTVNIIEHVLALNSQNALEIIKKYDIVVDATDNVATRYLINDACIMLKKPLVSGSALQFEGQLTVYGYENGPCYRCLFPIPPPPETVTNCGDGGVIGAVPGVIGTLQALEVVKIVLKMSGVLTGRLLLFDGTTTSFRTVRLRGKRNDCHICSDSPTITNLIDYEQFCQMRASDKDSRLELLSPEQRISAPDYHQLTEKRIQHLLVDVRSENEFEICKLDDSINIPIKEFLGQTLGASAQALIDKAKANQTPIYVVCRRGNDSQIAAARLQKLLTDSNIDVKDITGGLHAWTKNVDPEFPIY